MNKTNQLASCVFEQPNDNIEAQQVLKKMYPEIIYDSTNDSYNYRGYKFNYFKSGIGFGGSPNGYLLIDPEDPKLWLFTYGEKEDRWNDYLEHKKQQNMKFYEKDKYGYPIELSINKPFKNFVRLVCQNIRKII